LRELVADSWIADDFRLRVRLEAGLGRGERNRAPIAAEREELPEPQALSDHLREPKYDPFKTVAVTIKGHRVATTRHGDYVVATIDLKGLPSGAFTVKIHVTTVLGHHLSGARTYHTCAKKAEKNKPGKLR
jgi:hypothetical protein